MIRTRITVVSLLCVCFAALLVGIAALSASRAGAADTRTITQPVASHAATVDTGGNHPNVLTSASEQEVGRLALAAAARNFPTRNGPPQVALTRRIARDDLTKLGLQGIPRTTIEEPPLMLVILKGDFGTPNLPGVGNAAQQYKYVGYVYDLWAGIPTLVIASPDGHEFRTALNDPSLPAGSQVIVTAPVPSQGPLLHYGQAVPGVNPQQTSNSTPTVVSPRSIGTAVPSATITKP